LLIQALQQSMLMGNSAKGPLMKWKHQALILLGLLTVVPANANDNTLWQRSTLNQIIKKGELRVGLEPGYAPFEMLNKEKRVVGFDVDIAEEMAKAMGVKLKLIELDWNGILPALLTNQFDIIISGMTITSQRNLWINFTDPYMTVGQTILVRKKLARKIKSYRDLNSSRYTVTTKPGTTGLDAIKRLIPKAKLRLMESEWEAVKEVAEGRIDAFVYDLPFNSVAYARYKNKLGFINKPFTHERLGWGIRKGDPDFLNWLNHFLAQMKVDGRYKAIHTRWFKSASWQDQVEFK
jgi:polar amino acid transport system substrate-binding protein